MCKTKMAVNASQPTSISRKPSSTTSRATSTTSTRASPNPHHAPPKKSTSTTTSSSFLLDSSTATSTALSSTLSTLRNSLPENTNLHIYPFPEIRSATNNFLSKRLPSSTPSWRTSLRGTDVVIFQRPLLQPTTTLHQKLSAICRCHHMSIINLLGASTSNHHLFLVYSYVDGASLSLCLRNPHNPSFTVLSSWMSRIQIATDLAHGLEYIHIDTSLVHKYVKPSSIIVSDKSNSLNAKLCHFGTAELCGEQVADVHGHSNKRLVQFEGARGYMAPEFMLNGIATQKTDVYAFGVVILEIVSGEEALKYKFDRERGEYRRISVIEAAEEAVGEEGRLRRWVDKRLRDSFPVEVVEKLTRLALECVDQEEEKRPDMGRVAGKISKLYLESKAWEEKMKIPDNFSVSLVAR